MADGQHLVHVVNYPNPAIDGVVVVDDTIVSRKTSSPGLDFDRCVVFTRKVALEVDQLWEAGVRHVIHADQSPQVGLLVVLAAQKRLAFSANSVSFALARVSSNPDPLRLANAYVIVAPVVKPCRLRV